jgi:DNA-binding NarL/FixJ family response regulator
VTPFALVREGVCRILESERDIEILAEASSHLGIIPLLEGRKPDILIIDTGLPDLDIMKILELIREKSAKTKVILLLRTLDEKFIMDAISFGIRGFLTDTSNAEQFTQAIRTVNRNEIWLETKIITRILTRLLPSKRGSPRFVKHELTQREKEIVKLILQGYTNKQISKKLFITEPTVKSHLVNIFRKLGVGSRLQLIVQLLGNSNS